MHPGADVVQMTCHGKYLAVGAPGTPGTLLTLGPLKMLDMGRAVNMLVPGPRVEVRSVNVGGTL
jgi:hypothetical protein